MSIVGRALAQSVEESSVVCTPNHANGSGPLPQANKAFQPPPPRGGWIVILFIVWTRQFTEQNRVRESIGYRKKKIIAQFLLWILIQMLSEVETTL